jgi:hypothetical protein
VTGASAGTAPELLPASTAAGLAGVALARRRELLPAPPATGLARVTLARRREARFAVGHAALEAQLRLVLLLQRHRQGLLLDHAILPVAPPPQAPAYHARLLLLLLRVPAPQAPHLVPHRSRLSAPTPALAPHNASTNRAAHRTAPSTRAANSEHKSPRQEERGAEQDRAGEPGAAQSWQKAIVQQARRHSHGHPGAPAPGHPHPHPHPPRPALLSY